MALWWVTLQASINTTVEADSPDDITAEMVNQAVLDEHGKYPRVDKYAWDAEEGFDVLGEAEL